MAKRSLDIVIAGHDRTRRAFGSVQAGLGRLKGSLLSFRNLAVGGVGIYALVRTAREAVGAFADCEQQLAMISTMLGGDAMRYMGQYREALREMSKEFGEGTETLAKGLYDILSSGVEAGKALGMLRVSVKAARGGITDTTVAVDGLTTILNAYQLEADQAGRVSDLMFQIVKEGKINFVQLAENVGKLAPTARAAGLSLEEMSAVIATMVKVEKPERAMTALRAAIMHAAAGGESLLDLVQRFEGKSLTDIIAGGLSKRAAAGMALLSGNVATLRRELEVMRQAAGAAEEAFGKMAATPAMQLARARQRFVDLGRSLGQAVMPSVLLLTDELKRNEKALGDWAARLVRGGADVARFVAANRELIVSLAKVAAGVAGVIVLGPPLIGMLKGVSTAALFLAKNPLVLLGTAVAVLIATFIDWETVLDRIKGKLNVVMPGEMPKDAVTANRGMMERARSFHAEQEQKARRLAELREQEHLTNLEMLEARQIAEDLAKAYPRLADRIDTLGSSAAETREFFRLMNEQVGRDIRQARENQLTMARRALDELMFEREGIAQRLRDAEQAQEKLSRLRRRREDLRWYEGGKGNLDRAIERNEKLATGLDGIRQRWAELQGEIALTRDEIDRVQGVLAGPRQPTFVDRLREQLRELPDMIRHTSDRLRSLVRDALGTDYREKNKELLLHLKVVRAGGITDELERETEQIRLNYVKRIEAARKAGQDITLLEQARDEEIAQRRRKHEQREAEQRLGRQKTLGREIARLRIETTREGLARELALLKQAEKQALADARDEAEQALVRRKYDLLRSQAEQQARQQRTGPVSIGAVERGFLTRAPGQYDPYREQAKREQQIAKNTAAAARAGEAALNWLRTIAEKLGLKPPVADF